MSASGKQQYEKITDPPRTVKEAIDWLLRIGRKDNTYVDSNHNSDAFCTSVKKLLGNGANIEKNSFDKLFTALGKFIGWEKNDNGSNGKTGHIKNGTSKGIGKSNENNGQGYQSAYKNDENDLMTRWMSCGTRNLLRTAAKCCASDGGEGCGDCKADQSKACDGCCAKCPKQVCARIFCLIVPVLYRVFWYMQAKCNKGKAWEKQQVNGNNNGDGKTDLKEFMEACGFEPDKLAENKTGGQLTRNNGNNELGSLMEALGQMKQVIETALQNESNDPSKNFLKGASNQAAKKPSSLTDLLLWLQFLPYCSKYKDVLEELKKQINGNDKETFVTHLNNTISQLPMLFLQIEGKGERGNTSPVHGSSLFLKIAELSKCQYIFDQKYYEEGTVVKMLLCVFPVIHWGLNALKDRCTTGSCGNTIENCEKTKKLLESLGWNGSKDSESPTELKPIINDKTKCKDLKDYLSIHFIGNIVGFTGLKRILESAWKEQNGPTGFNNNGQYLPQTIYEMLIWLMGLPVSGKFKELKSEKKDEIKEALEPLTQILFEVPNLFITLNGDLSGMLSSMFQCHGISDSSNAYQYGTDGSECLKIFSAIVAILFPVIRYLQQRCNGNGVFKDNGSWSTKNTNVAPLSEFLKFMGFGSTIASSTAVSGSEFHSGVLMKIFGDLTQQNGGTGQLKTLYDCAKAALKKNSNTGSHTPTTIRQMMLWLIGLPVTKEYGDNGTGLIQTVTTKATGINGLSSKITNGPTSFQHQLQHSIVGMMTVISQIEGGLGSVLDFLKEGFKDTNGSGGSQNKFEYKSGQDLFTQFTKYVTSVHVQLRFLKVMCKTEKENGGWKECKYASNGACGCNGSVASCLKLFLQNGNSGGSGANGNKFKLYQSGNSEHLQMGFNQDANAPGSSQNLIGDNIHIHLELMLDAIPTPPTQPTATVEFKKPLSLLTQYCVAIGPLEPDSLGDHFDVFQQLANGMWKKIQTQVKGDIKQITTTDQNGETASENLKTALKEVWPGTHNGTHPSDLVSLTGCSDSTCTPFIASLSYGLYKYFDPTKLGTPPKTMDWLYMKMSSLYGKLTHLHKSMKAECQCCKSGDSKSCQGITQCPVCLPQLYKMGLVFGDPVTIGPNKCFELMEKLKKVLDAASALCVVFKSIDEKRFWPYLLFSAKVVENNNGKLTVTGDDNYNCYTYKLKEMYDAYLKDKKEKDTQAAQTNKTQRDNALKCNCQSHTYEQPQAGSGTATVVTLTLYFQDSNIKTTIQLVVPHHGPLYNPLVRFYPRNLKSIVDWLLRIGQTRLEQGDEKKGIEEMCNTFFPKIQGYVTGMEEDVFKHLVNGVTTMMGMENKGKEGVETEVEKEFKDVTEKLNKKLSNNGDGFEKTFSSILKFSPNSYINKVITDFGKQVKKVNTNGVQKDRSFECIAKSVSECMQTALQKIKELVKKNKSEMEKYGVTGIPELSGTEIDDVQQLNNISNLKQLCDGFKDFHEAYDKVTKAFNSHLSTAQNGDGQQYWTNIKKCVEAFNTLGECVQELGELSSMSSADSMTQASEKLNDISGKLDKVIEKLSASEIQQFSDEVDKFIEKLDEALKKEGEKGLAQALKDKDSSNDFNTFLKYYVSELITKMKSNSIGSDKNNTSVDIHLRVRNDLQQLSECLKVMCEVCGTGMKDFAEELRKCVDQGKGHLDGIRKTKLSLEHLYMALERFNKAVTQSQLTEFQITITTIEQLLKDKYIFQTQPIVDKLINNDATEKMTTYLKSLPDLIRDRYVLQKWTDDAKHFCGVQSFNNGIVKKTDMDGITGLLKSLLKDTYHNATGATIHDFQVKSLIYNFCHKEAMEKIQVGLEVISGVKDVLQNGVEWTNISGKKDKLSPLLTKLSTNPYLKYFASHLRDSVGYHTLSNTLGALEQVKDKLEAKPPNGEPPEWNKIQELLKKETMDTLHTKLQSLVDQLNREYIFEYPPFDWQKSCQKLVDAKEKAARQKRSLPTSPSPAPSSSSTTCDMCAPSMAYIFIGFVPQMYRLFKMLREMTKNGNQHTLVYSNNGTDAKTTTMSSLAGLLSREGWRLKDGNDSDDEAFDLDASKKGTDVCTLLEKIIGDAEPGVLLAQKGNASATDSSLQPLDKLFKAVMQHFKEERNKKKEEREKALEDKFKADTKNAGLKFVAPLPQLPSTVRQVLFWLHELDTNKAFYDAMSEHIEALCHQSSIDITPSTILHVLKLSITQCLEVLATIEDPGRQNADYYYELYTEEHYYDYPVTNIPLFFYTFVEKLMAAFLELNFVCVQCEFTGKQGGWKDCHIGKSEHSMEGQNCRCTKSHTTVSSVIRVSVEGSVVCPRPMYSFLFSDQKNQLKVPTDPTHRLPYMSKGTMPCGFKLKNKAITDPATKGDAHTPTTPTPTSMTGSVLVEPLRKLVGGHVKGRHNGTTTNGINTLSNVIYLRDLLRYTLCLAVRPPWSMSENMAFFYRVTESWKRDNKGVTAGVRVAHPNNELVQSIHAEIAMFPGTFKAELLTTAVERFAGIEDKEHQTSVPGHSNTSHQYDLKTLMGCQEANATSSGTTVQCSYFMFPLSLDVYTHYDHKNSRAYLSWILNFAFGIYGQLKALEEMIKEKECVKSTASSNSNCPSLPMCPEVLSALYQSGSSFMDQKVLADVNKTNAGNASTTRKTCNDFHTVLKGLLNCNTAHCTPLHNLIVQCEAFLWSIRLPFSLVQLSLWSFAILFISYVFVVPLDHFKIKSHLFNRLKYTMHPSLLIADQQRRVSEVAYFSL